MNPPKVFISATSGDLRSIRQFVKAAAARRAVEASSLSPERKAQLLQNQ